MTVYRVADVPGGLVKVTAATPRGYGGTLLLLSGFDSE